MSGGEGWGQGVVAPAEPVSSDSLPVLTEVVPPPHVTGLEGPPLGVPLPVLVHEVELKDALPQGIPMEPAAEDPLQALSRQDAELVTQQVLTQLSGQIDRMFEFRLREALTPVLDKVVTDVVHQAREELGRVMADVVRRAVSQELSRRRAR